MTYELEYLVRDREMRPRALASVTMRVGDVVQLGVAGADGTVRFGVPDIATVTIEVDGLPSAHQVRVPAGPVRRIAIAQ